MNINRMIALNNERRKLLNPENEAYYSNMVLFVRTSPIDQGAGEELLLEILEHLIEAQSQGRSAKDLFGDDPVAYCRELVSELPKPSLRERLWHYGVVMWGTLTWYFFAEFVDGLLTKVFGIDMPVLNKINVVNVVATALMAVIVVKLVFLFINSSMFSSKQHRRFRTLLHVVILSLVIFTPAIIALEFRSEILEFSVSPWLSLMLFVFGYTVMKLVTRRIDGFKPLRKAD
jgi:DNA-binding ferritin-like protein (Dps family)